MVHTSWHSLCGSIGNTDSVVVVMVLVVVVLEVVLVFDCAVFVVTSDASTGFSSRSFGNSVWANVTDNNVSNMKHLVYIVLIFLKTTWKTKTVQGRR